MWLWWLSDCTQRMESLSGINCHFTCSLHIRSSQADRWIERENVRVTGSSRRALDRISAVMQCRSPPPALRITLERSSFEFSSSSHFLSWVCSVFFLDSIWHRSVSFPVSSPPLPNKTSLTFRSTFVKGLLVNSFLVPAQISLRLRALFNFIQVFF